jgi:hypothetical protein
VLIAKTLVLDALIIRGSADHAGQLSEHIDLLVVDSAEFTDGKMEPKFELSDTLDMLVSQL